MSTAQDLPLAYGETSAAPALRLVPVEPLDFDEAVRRVRPRLHRYAIRRLGDSHEAEELVQEALLRAYSYREQLLTEEDLSAWTTVVTGRLVIDRLRVRGRSTSVAEVPENSRMGRDTADVVVARDEARTALDALDAMPARQAALLWAREVEGQTYEQMCERFGMTEPAVRSVLTRARKALRKEYALRGGTLPVGGLAVLAPWVAGLSWADRLRSAVSRVTAPAALATVGITALGGLVLAPFTPGLAPASPVRPAQAVVSSPLVAGSTASSATLVTAAQEQSFLRRSAASTNTTAPPAGQVRLTNSGSSEGSAYHDATAPVDSINCTPTTTVPVADRVLAGYGCTDPNGSEAQINAPAEAKPLLDKQQLPSHVGAAGLPVPCAVVPTLTSLVTCQYNGAQP